MSLQYIPIVLLLVIGFMVTGVCASEDAKYGTWDKFFYNVQLPLEAVVGTSRIKLLVYHSYPGSLHDLRVVARGDARLQVIAEPAPLRVLDPTEIQPIVLKLRRMEPAGSFPNKDTAALTVEFRAREFAQPKSLELMVPLTPKGESELNERMSTPVGRMEVKVGGLGNQVYYLYLIPMLALLAWLLWRRKMTA